MLNPSTPFLVRENFPGKDPYIVATYGEGGGEGGMDGDKEGCGRLVGDV